MNEQPTLAKARDIPGLHAELSYREAAARTVEVRSRELFDHADGVLDTGVAGWSESRVVLLDDPEPGVAGAELLRHDRAVVVDPVRNMATQVPIPVRDPATPFSTPRKVMAASPYWGEEVIWNSKANAHNPMLDAEGRVWYTAVVRAHKSRTR